MDNSFREILWNQFGASIDMLENSVKACPADLWDTDSKFWYTAYHTIFFLDYYLTIDSDKFSPPLPFSMAQLNLLLRQNGSEVPDWVSRAGIKY
ncbi:MAG TPA: hypothetical protein PKA90_11910 [Ignavibacteria bacterium]|mgnify:CR=1 FL=1|nr:hypothetical protein [Ignavibacteria bacterium]HMR41125.1 hypothetical protein [Ignavibacteria bacterium]